MAKVCNRINIHFIFLKYKDGEAGVMLLHLPELKPGEAYYYMLTVPGHEEMVGTLVADTGVMHRVESGIEEGGDECEGEGMKKIG